MTAAPPDCDDGVAGAWCFYDWADHAWATPVAAALIGPWMLSLAKKGVGSHGVVVGIGPLVLRGNAFPSAMVTVAAVVQLLVLPALGAHIDSRSTKRRWLLGACVAGSVVCWALGLSPTHTWARLRHDLRRLSGMPHTLRYALAYLCIGDATSGVISLSSIFLTHELFDDSTTKAKPFLLVLILVIQFVALGGAVLGGSIAARVGAKPVLVATLVVWLAVIIYAWAAVYDRTEAVFAGVVIGLGVGITTPLARSVYSQMIREGCEATFFSLYGAGNTGTAFIAPLLFTVVVDVTGSFRQAILSLVALFAIGLGLLASTDIDAAVAEAHVRPDWREGER